MTVWSAIALSLAGGLGMYFGVAGLFELLYYRRRRAAPDGWKCQPRRFADARARRNEILLGTANMTAAGVVSGLFLYHVTNGGYSSIYTSLDDHGLAFSIATAILYFVVTDGALYWAHRLLHRRALFRAIHRVHHRWTAPTAFTALAMHPAELALYQAIMFAPLFVLPIHAAGLIAVVVYQNLIALIDHSGVDLGSAIPWQPPARFHDDHHKYFHVNYGQTLGLWDRVFGTWRRTGRVYGAEVFGGKGAPLGAGDSRLVDYRRPREGVEEAHDARRAD